MEDENKTQAIRILSQADYFIADMEARKDWYTLAGLEEKYNAMIANMADVRQQLVLRYDI